MDELIAYAEELGIHLTSSQLESFKLYYRELVSWNEQINLTSITDYQEVQLKHFADSLSLYHELSTKDKTRVLDVGTGAGFPGVPLRIVLPNIKLSLVEATTKKSTFLIHLVKILNLGSVEVIQRRAEKLANMRLYREAFHIVLARSVARMATLTELCLPFCCLGGSFIALKKGNILDEIKEAERAIKIIGGRFREIRKVNLKKLSDGRCIVIVDKISTTPDKYPRRDGIPQKRPLN